MTDKRTADDGQTQRVRYQRQISIPQIGEQGQQKLRGASVLVIGAGGLGCPLLTALACAGVGRLGVVDGDVVSLSNLNRQYLYSPSDLGANKALSAARWLRTFRPDCEVCACAETVTEDNAPRLLHGWQLVLLAVDSMTARLLLNRACLRKQVPFIDGGVDGFFGRITPVLGPKSACLACAAPARESARKPDSIATVTLVTGGIQAQLAAAFLLLGSNPGSGSFYYDGLRGTLDWEDTVKDPQCPACAVMG